MTRITKGRQLLRGFASAASSWGRNQYDLSGRAAVVTGGAQGIVACYDVTEDWTPIYDASNIQ